MTRTTLETVFERFEKNKMDTLCANGCRNDPKNEEKYWNESVRTWSIFEAKCEKYFRENDACISGGII